MLLIADSGSTKTTWLLVGPNSKEEWQTEGLNPVSLSAESMIRIIAGNQQLVEFANEVETLYFYGAGCNGKARCITVASVLQMHFINATIRVDSDLKGAVLAVTGNEKGIIGILGTGSNACYWDGSNIIQYTPALGYILGDEGSGSKLGIHLIRNFLYRKLPISLQSDMQMTYQLDKNAVIDQVYQQEQAKAYLASFTPFLVKHKEHPFVQEMISNHFETFIDNHIVAYTQQYPNTPVHFVGSIAHFFDEILSNVLLKKGIKKGKILRNPTTELANYIIANEKE